MPMTACQTPAQSFSATPLATSYPTTLFSLPPPASTRSLTYRPTLSIFSLYDKVLRRPVELASLATILGVGPIVRYVPIASLRSAEKQWVFAPLDHLEVGDRLADQSVSF